MACATEESLPHKGRIIHTSPLAVPMVKTQPSPCKARAVPNRLVDFVSRFFPACQAQLAVDAHAKVLSIYLSSGKAFTAIAKQTMIAPNARPAETTLREHVPKGILASIDLTKD